MAKPYKFSATLVVVTALCLLSLVEIAQSKASKAQTKGAAAATPAESKSAPTPGGAEEFYVQGQVYCDTCRAQFITKASSFLQGSYSMHYTFMKHHIDNIWFVSFSFRSLPNMTIIIFDISKLYMHVNA